MSLDDMLRIFEQLFGGGTLTPDGTSGSGSTGSTGSTSATGVVR
jgi:hypothetical protein